MGRRNNRHGSRCNDLGRWRSDRDSFRGSGVVETDDVNDGRTARDRLRRAALLSAS